MSSARSGFRFTLFDESSLTPFDKLYEIFQEVIAYTNGDVDEAFEWIETLDKEYQITTPEYTLEDFRQELIDKGLIEQEPPEIPESEVTPQESGDQNSGDAARSKHKMTAKLERVLRKRALNQIFGKIKPLGAGGHRAQKSGPGAEANGQFRTYSFGDDLSQISMTESIKNAQVNHGVDRFEMNDQDLVVHDTEHFAQMSTVLMIDISHSMILYGEDRITPAKKVAMALAELIKTRYPKDQLDILVFGNDAWSISLKELPYLEVGPYHTNTVAGLNLALDLLRKKKQTNKQIFMITDGKPSCLTLSDGTYYKNPNGLDPHIVGRCCDMARLARKLHIPITTFMIAQDPYLIQFIQEFTQANQGKAFYTGLDDLGSMIFEDYENNRSKRMR
jgi:uncharacterized protein with von Willebrand factor type A (vWA) domain